jgi:hypothetical protein
MGRVRGSFPPGVLRADFLNPPGKHLAPMTSSAGTKLDWYAGFLSGRGSPFCTFGHSADLLALPLH